MLVASAVFYEIYGGQPLSVAPAANIGAIALPAAAMASVYFLLNSGLTAMAVSSETRQLRRTASGASTSSGSR